MVERLRSSPYGRACLRILNSRACLRILISRACLRIQNLRQGKMANLVGIMSSPLPYGRVPKGPLLNSRACLRILSLSVEPPKGSLSVEPAYASKTSAKGEPVELSNRPPTAANVKWPIFLGCPRQGSTVKERER
jgi:hypothetical protein